MSNWMSGFIGFVIGIVLTVALLAAASNGGPGIRETWLTKHDCQQTYLDIADRVCKDLP